VGKISVPGGLYLILRVTVCDVSSEYCSYDVDLMLPSLTVSLIFVLAGYSCCGMLLSLVSTHECILALRIPASIKHEIG